MTQGEKAKAYDEAIERAKDFMNGEVHYELKMGENIMCWIFPELRESENERIRKALIERLIDYRQKGEVTYLGVNINETLTWLEKQGEPTEINPSEFDLRLNKLLKQFESLPKEELISNLSYYLNVIQNDGTYKIEKQDEKSQRMISAEAKEALYNKPTWSEEDEAHINSIIAYLLDYKLLVYEEDMNVANGVQKELDWLNSLKQRML